MPDVRTGQRVPPREAEMARQVRAKAKRAQPRTSLAPMAATADVPHLKVSATADDLLLAALQSGGDAKATGRFLMTFKEGATAAGIKSLQARKGLRMADARDFNLQAVDLAATGDADAVVFPEIGVALVG